MKHSVCPLVCLVFPACVIKKKFHFKKKNFFKYHDISDCLSRYLVFCLWISIGYTQHLLKVSFMQEVAYKVVLQW